MSSEVKRRDTVLSKILLESSTLIIHIQPKRYNYKNIYHNYLMSQMSYNFQPPQLPLFTQYLSTTSVNDLWGLD